MRGDHELNEIKASKIPGLAPFRFATEDEVEEHLGCKPGYIGPVAVDGEKVAIFADRSAVAMSDFVCGANEAGFHLTGVNFGRDLPEPQVADIRNVVSGDPSPDGKGVLDIPVSYTHLDVYKRQLDATLRKLPGVFAYALAPEDLVLRVTKDNADVRAIAFTVEHDNPAKLKVVSILPQRQPACKAGPTCKILGLY